MKRERTSSFDIAREMNFDDKILRNRRFESSPEPKNLGEIYNPIHLESADKGMSYIREMVKLQGNIGYLLEKAPYTESELAKELKYTKKEAFVVSVALERMQRMGTTKIVGSKPGPEKNTVEPIYSLAAKK